MSRGQFTSAVAVVLALSGCALLPEGDALTIDEPSDQICAPSPPDADDAVMFGTTWMWHRGARPITITDVELVDPQGLALVDAVLVPHGEDDYLVGLRYLSTTEPFPDAWEDRVPAKGATLTTGDISNLVVTVRDEGQGHLTADGVRLTYESDRGRVREQETPGQFIVTTIGCDAALDVDDES